MAALLMNDPFFGDNGNFTGWTMSFADNSPIPELNMGDSTICINHVIDLSATAGMDSYLWNTLDNGQELCHWMDPYLVLEPTSIL